MTEVCRSLESRKRRGIAPGHTRVPRKTECVAHTLNPFPDSPPAEMLEDLDQAQRVIAELQAMHMSLRFTFDQGYSRLLGSLVDHDGNVIREMPAMQALCILSGDHSAGIVLEARA